MDGCIIVSDKERKIDNLIKPLHRGDENFKFTDEGSIVKYLGVDINQIDSDSFAMTQHFLIDRLLSLLGLDKGRTNSKMNPVGKPLLNRDLDGVDMKYDWKYRSAIGILTYLTGSVRPDIAVAVHQCARSSNNPKRPHSQAVMCIARYLLHTRDKGITCTPKPK